MPLSTMPGGVAVAAGLSPHPAHCPVPAVAAAPVPCSTAPATLRPGQHHRIQATSPARGDLIAISISASIGFLLGLSFYVS